ncbi:MAG TPA: M48 family metalloprotease [Anaerolineae bacterium]|nr:M48 family metalloprotease [Anaerolineae bacterium]HNU04456.1 M48 family metalloprotease [Anaerolineae bacterium]
MTSRNSASAAFAALLALALATAALLLGLLAWQSPHLARGIWLACQSASQAVEGYLPLAGLLLPLGLLLAATLAGLGKLFSQLRFTRALLGDLASRRSPLPPSLAQLVDALGLTGRLALVDDPEPYAFAAGLARPAIWLSSGLLALLDEAELAAVLRHERHHLRRRDPLRVLLARSLAQALFFLPAAAALCELYMEAKEADADAACGANHALAAALVKLLRAGAPAPARASLAAARPSATAGRIQRLLEGEPSGRRSLDPRLLRRLAISLALAVALWSASAVSQSQAASPLVGGECGYIAAPSVQENAETPANFTPMDVNTHYPQR